MQPSLQGTFVKHISILKNPVQKYAWGSRTALQSLLGWPEPWKDPAAELWMGAHPKAPSKVQVDGQWRSLIDVIAADPVSILGARAAVQFSNRLPFLFKVLAADRPLSIQVHPHTNGAREGFDRENRLTIPMGAPNRNYKDASHKPECLCAVTRFEAMKGFRAPNEVLAMMNRVFTSTPLTELDPLRKDPSAAGMKRFYSSLMGMEPARCTQVVKEAVKGAAENINVDRAFYWLLELNREYPGDVGVLSPLFLNLVKLSPGEAIYVPAGELHAYLRGVGMEIMASSDNVLRCGLTPKHVDIPELLKNVNFSTAPAKIQRPPLDVNFERVYKTPADEFQLSEIVLKNQETFRSETERSVEILICMEGSGMIEPSENGQEMSLSKGVSVIIPSAVPQYRISGNITLYKGAVSKVQ
ncbi:MAG: mannose-6-phosphate isomerase, class I [Deltaproteobacteria bacterium]|nr:mannose-6-phosphate isomerase, class I [Deltaproteobacteria bacterium]